MSDSYTPHWRGGPWDGRHKPLLEAARSVQAAAQFDVLEIEVTAAWGQRSSRWKDLDEAELRLAHDEPPDKVFMHLNERYAGQPETTVSVSIFARPESVSILGSGSDWAKTERGYQAARKVLGAAYGEPKPLGGEQTPEPTPEPAADPPTVADPTTPPSTGSPAFLERGVPTAGHNGTVPETPLQHNEPATPRTRLGEAWDRLSPQRFWGAVVVGIVGAVAAGLILYLIIPGASEQAASTARACEQAVEETRVELSIFDSPRPLKEDARGAATDICRASLWTAPPSLFGLSIERARDPAFSGLVATGYPTGEARTASVEEIVREAASYAGDPIYVVGRIQRNALLDDGETREVRLVGRDGESVTVVRMNASRVPFVSEGDVVASVVFVAARGTARFTGSDEAVDTAYALGDSLEVVGEGSASRAIREEVGALRQGD